MWKKGKRELKRTTREEAVKSSTHTHTIYHPDRGQKWPYESTRTGRGCPAAGRGNDQCTQPRELGQKEGVRVWRKTNKTLKEKKNGRIKLKITERRQILPLDKVVGVPTNTFPKRQESQEELGPAVSALDARDYVLVVFLLVRRALVRPPVDALTARVVLGRLVPGSTAVGGVVLAEDAGFSVLTQAAGNRVVGGTVKPASSRVAVLARLQPPSGR